ncbi:hypothetical protein K438DRAFT_457753 [Mycena galopus ATCC 62051]|nr:hypothetical protein K438DRAFT_457753 [Mycena galopus ATCC 62051]
MSGVDRMDIFPARSSSPSPLCSHALPSQVHWFSRKSPISSPSQRLALAVCRAPYSLPPPLRRRRHLRPKRLCCLTACAEDAKQERINALHQHQRQRRSRGVYELGHDLTRPAFLRRRFDFRGVHDNDNARYCRRRVNCPEELTARGPSEAEVVAAADTASGTDSLTSGWAASLAESNLAPWWGTAWRMAWRTGVATSSTNGRWMSRSWTSSSRSASGILTSRSSLSEQGGLALSHVGPVGVGTTSPRRSQVG